MAKIQYPIDGKPGKGWKVTSYMGWRIHPVQKTKKHHNGTDIWSASEPCWVEAFCDGVVLEAKKSTAPGGGFGNYVVIRHKIDGKDYTSLYAHMADGSLKVKKGQKVEAGTPLGKMGSTGMSTGKHLHFEIWIGKKHGWSANGKGFVEPIKFIEALIAKQAVLVEGPKETPEVAPAPAPVHEAPKPVLAVAKPAVKPAAKPAKVHKVKAGESLSGIASKYKTTAAKLASLNGIKNANLIKVGQSIKLP